jgi:hypothetical protein
MARYVQLKRTAYLRFIYFQFATNDLPTVSVRSLDGRAVLMNDTAQTSIKYVPLTSPVHNPARPFVDAGGDMARRQLLTEGERRQLFGAPADPDALVRHYTLSRSDLDFVATRRGDANRLGFAVQLALLRGSMAKCGRRYR